MQMLSKRFRRWLAQPANATVNTIEQFYAAMGDPIANSTRNPRVLQTREEKR